MKTLLLCLLLSSCAQVPAKVAEVQQCIMRAIGQTDQGYMVVNMACVKGD